MRVLVEYLTNNPKAIRKFIVALAAALAVVATVWADGAVTGTEWIEVALAFLAALGVYAVPNQDEESAR